MATDTPVHEAATGPSPLRSEVIMATSELPSGL